MNGQRKTPSWVNGEDQPQNCMQSVSQLSCLMCNYVCQCVEKGLGDNLPAGGSGAGLRDELGAGGWDGGERWVQ